MKTPAAQLRRLGILVIVLVCGCQGYEFARDPVTGRKTLKDTPYARSEFTREVDGYIVDEQTGRRPPPRLDLTWNGWWIDLIARQKKYLIGDSNFYVSYIIDARRKADLPELKFPKKT